MHDGKDGAVFSLQGSPGLCLPLSTCEYLHLTSRSFISRALHSVFLSPPHRGWPFDLMICPMNSFLNSWFEFYTVLPWDAVLWHGLCCLWYQSVSSAHAGRLILITVSEWRDWNGASAPEAATSHLTFLFSCCLNRYELHAQQFLLFTFLSAFTWPPWMWCGSRESLSTASPAVSLNQPQSNSCTVFKFDVFLTKYKNITLILF